MVYGTGCSSHTHTYTIPKVVKKYKLPDRCKTLYKTKNTYSTILIQKDCLRVGLTTIVVLVLYTKDKGKLAAKESLIHITNYLKFKPQLVLITMGNIKGMPFYLFAITGESR
jgi:hypothetical protein